MFKLANKDAPKIVRDWPVVIQEPGDDGRIISHKAKVDYELISDAEKDELIAEGGDVPFLNRVVKGWKHFALADGSEAPCNDETKPLFFEVTYVRVALVNGYFMAAAGGRRKN
jgi:hypothetical protein